MNEYKNIWKFLMKRILDNFARFSQTIDSIPHYRAQKTFLPNLLVAVPRTTSSICFSEAVKKGQQ